MANKISDYMVLTKGFNRITLNSLEKIVREAVYQNRDVAIDMNRSQLDEGELSGRDNEKIPDSYAPATIERKTKKGQRTDVITLEDSGRFKSRFKTRFGPKSFEISSSDRKKNVLVQNFSERIFGLQPQNIKVLAEMSKPQIVKGILDLIK